MEGGIMLYGIIGFIGVLTFANTYFIIRAVIYEYKSQKRKFDYNDLLKLMDKHKYGKK
jgi:uncharacterized membrane protein YkvI